MSKQLIDLSHVIEDGLITYRGLPAPIICDYLSREDSKLIYEDATFQIGKIEMVSNTGTYIDCPFHRYADGKDLAQTSIENFAELDGIVITSHYTKKLANNASIFLDFDVAGKAVLIYTGWAEHWNTDKYYYDHPFLTEDAAKYLKEQKVKLVGIDSHNMDDSSGKKRPAHTILLGAEILIVEHLCNLESLPHKGFRFSAVPPKFKGVGTFPVRAMARII